MTNPYRAPGAVVADVDRPQGSPVKGVIYGLLVDIIGTTIATVVIMMVYGIYLAATGDEAERALSQVDLASPIGIVETVGGFVFSFFGGYVCARVARRSELKCAAVVAAITSAVGLVIGMEMFPLSVNVLFAVLAVAAVMAGGYAGARRNAKLS